MNNELKPCPFCGNEVRCVDSQVLEQERYGVHTNGRSCLVFICKECEYEIRFSGVTAHHKQRQNWDRRIYD